GGVDRHDAPPGLLVGNRKGDRARSGADVENRGLLDLRDQREAPLDDELGLGAWNEDARVHPQRQPPEPPLAEDVRQWLTRLPPSDQLLPSSVDGLVEPS